ncbi:MAG: protein translocase subunit SecD [Gemmataceae bacterium]|nr:protein translocase subunit SecD [Gemmataceae bacterium]
MRQYTRKIILCLIPILLSLWAIWYAYRHDRFKLGVDLSGGTILVYEIDTRKQQKAEGLRGESPAKQAELLAESLKRRIDPNDLYNIVIRPAGESRVEIILPTGGPERDRQATEQWQELLRTMEKKYAEYGVKNLDVNRGRVQELAERIQQIAQQHTWAKKLFNTPASLHDLVYNRLLAPVDLGPGSEERNVTLLMPFVNKRTEQLREVAPKLSRQAATAVAAGAASPLQGMAATAALVKELPPILRPFRADNLLDLIAEVKERINDYSKERAVDAWFRQQAWNALLDQVLEKWPQLKSRKQQIYNIQPDHYDELIGRIQVGGDSIAQAFVSILEPVMGKEAVGGESDKGPFIGRKEIRDFVFETYGPSLQSIEAVIAKNNETYERSRDVTVEQVQRIKELITKIGSLEFRILANWNDDSAAIKDAEAMINNASNAADLKDRAVKGLPPPPPTVTGQPNDPPKVYELTTLPRGFKSKVTYSWVELGPQERHQLGLDNAARNEPGRGHAWQYLANRRGKATQIEPYGRKATDKRQFVLGGALFYSREAEDRNLPEEERRKKQLEYFVLARNPEIDPETGKETPKIDGSYLVSAASQASEGRPAVSFTFNTQGGNLFRDLTRKNVPSGAGAGDESSQIKRHLAIVLDGLIQSAPTINSEIGQHGQITGNFTPREVDVLVNTLRSGALPATLKPQPVSESTMGATLGQDTIRMGLSAVALTFGAVMLFMIVYYRFAGVVASIALLANLVLTIGFMVAVQATFTLPGLAGLVLMLGMAVDANVLIYERLREERERGASLSLALRNGYDRAFPAIIDTHLTSIFTAIVLYVVGNDQLKGFGVSLTAGLVISLFTSLYMTRLIFDVWQYKGWLKKLSMFRLFARPDIDFMAIRHYWFTITLVLTVLGIGLFIGRLPNDLNIDFVGGTAYTGLLNEGKNVEELRGLLGEARQEKLLQVAKVEELNAKENLYRITYAAPKDTRTVTLANRPAGDTPAEREQNVQQRAQMLPDVSVEQIFSTTFKETEPGKSPLFNVRTSEKEPDLVQTSLDRLLQVEVKGQWQPLLRKVVMAYDREELLRTGRETTLTFKDASTGKPIFASPSFVRTLLNRELLKAFGEREGKGIHELRDLPFQVELTGEGRTNEGRFETMKLTFTPTSGTLDEETRTRINKALEETSREFRDRPQPERLETFDTQLAAETRLRAMYAVLLSWGAILLYLWFRFGNWTFGLAAVCCLVHDLFFTLGIIAACHYLHGTWLGDLLLLEDFKLDLTGVAALLTLVGYSVNDTIVVFDRIREVRGKNPELTPQMINDSVNQTLSRTLLASLTTFLVVFVLYVWGGPGVHLFAFIMVVGVVVGTYSSIYIASPLLLIFGEGSRAAKGRERQPQRPTAVETGIQPAR